MGMRATGRPGAGRPDAEQGDRTARIGVGIALLGTEAAVLALSVRGVPEAHAEVALVIVAGVALLGLTVALLGPVIALGVRQPTYLVALPAGPVGGRVSPLLAGVWPGGERSSRLPAGASPGG
ncbi:MAG TPA: hypothetical protein VGD43_15235, partial [Micromonospora sp.]